MEQVLVVVYWCDLPQFELFCYSLNRFWRSNKKIKIIISTKVKKDICKNITRVNIDRIKNHVEKVVIKYLSRWKYTVEIGEKNLHASGWAEQQFYKVLGSTDKMSNETVVFDCKDVLVKDLSVEDFKNKVNHYLIEQISNVQEYNLKRNVSAKNTVQEYWGVECDTLPVNLTPWIWRNKDVYRFMRAIERRENKNLNDLEFFPGDFEIESFYVFLKKVFQHARSNYESMLIDNSSSRMYYYPSYHKNENYNELHKFKILKVYRNLFKYEKYINNVIVILQNKNFPDSLIEKWKNEHSDYLDNWKSHSDLEIEMYKDYLKL